MIRPFGDGNDGVSRLAVLAGLVALPVMALWNRLATIAETPLPREPTYGEPRVIEHERDWMTYIRGYDAHNGPGGSPEAPPSEGRFWRGLAVWAEGQWMRGYTKGKHVYLCPDAPRIVRVHQAAHAPAFGAVFDPLRTEPRENGGLPDEPLATFDVMLPGRFPHSLLRATDRRGIGGAYAAWVHDRAIRRVRE